MATTNAEFLTILAEFRSRSTYEIEYVRVLDELRTEVDFSGIRSCVSFGTGTGEQEIEFIGRFLPGLREFTAVDSDRESLGVFQGHVKDGRLPGVATTIVETTVQEWRAADGSVDCAMMFNLFIHLDQADRQALIEKIKLCLNPGGIAVIVNGSSGRSPNVKEIVKRFKSDKDSLMYSEVEKDMLAGGFSLLLARDIDEVVDLSNPNGNLVKIFQLYTDFKASEQQLLAAFTESENGVFNNPRKLAIFKN